MNENEVLAWLIEQKNSATIEEVTDEILEDLIAEHEYVVVYFCKFRIFKDSENIFLCELQLDLAMKKMKIPSVNRFWASWKISMMN